MVEPRTVTFPQLSSFRVTILSTSHFGHQGTTDPAATLCVEVTTKQVRQRIGHPIVSLVRLLHPTWESALLPWVFDAAVAERAALDQRAALADGVIGWRSPELADSHPHLLDPLSSLSLLSLAGEGLVVARYLDGGLAGIATRLADPTLTELKRNILAGFDIDTIVSTMAAADQLATIEIATRRPIVHQKFDDAEIDPLPFGSALLLPTIDHLCAHIASVSPELDARPSTIGRGVLSALRATAADALYGSPSPHSSTVAGNSPTTPPPPPDPLDDHAVWLAWLHEPATPEPFAISRLLCDVYRRRVDLQEEFPDLAQVHHRLAYLRWAAAFAADPPTNLPAGAIPQAKLPEVDPPSTVRHDGRGITIVGYFESALGLGEAARIMARNCQLTGERISTRTWRHVVSPPVVWRDRSPDVAYDVQIICLNGGDLAGWNRAAPPGFHDRAYRIGLWFWETDRIPNEMAAGAAFVDEIWVTSEFAAAAVRSVLVDAVVRVVPLGIDLSSAPTVSKGSARRAVRPLIEQGIGKRQIDESQWWCGFSFDLSSHLDRKNPIGLIRAWREAFPNETHEARLILKTMQGHLHSDAAEQLLAEIGDRPDILHVDDAWNAADHHNFIRALDVYASLHRSEGYGLLLLEALALGTPVVATDGTGTTAFLHADNSWLIPSVSVPARHSNRGYHTTGNVADPDESAAALVLSTLFADRFDDEATRRARMAQVEVSRLANGSAAADWIRRRLAEIRRTVPTA